jgi:hypothetical protein
VKSIELNLLYLWWHCIKSDWREETTWGPRCMWEDNIKMGVRLLTRFIWVRIGTGGVLLRTHHWTKCKCFWWWCDTLCTTITSYFSHCLSVSESQHFRSLFCFRLQVTGGRTDAYPVGPPGWACPDMDEVWEWLAQSGGPAVCVTLKQSKVYTCVLWQFAKYCLFYNTNPQFNYYCAYTFVSVEVT